MKSTILLSYLFVLTAFALPAVSALAQSGGPFTITQSVIANGGGVSSGGMFGITGTSGQPAAGTNMIGGVYDMHGGFWQQTPLAPSAANVSVSGRVSTNNGQGLRNAIATLTDSHGVTRRAITSSFGHYRFEDVEAGQTYVITVTSKRFQFTPRVISVSDELTNVDFVSLT